MVSTLITCPKCQNPGAVSVTETALLTVPVKIKFWVVNYQTEIKVNVSGAAAYCMNCGFLRLTFGQARQI
jgi:hypothetical protein